MFLERRLEVLEVAEVGPALPVRSRRTPAPAVRAFADGVMGVMEGIPSWALAGVADPAL